MMIRSILFFFGAVSLAAAQSAVPPAQPVTDAATGTGPAHNPL